MIWGECGGVIWRSRRRGSITTVLSCVGLHLVPGIFPQFLSCGCCDISAASAFRCTMGLVCSINGSCGVARAILGTSMQEIWPIVAHLSAILFAFAIESCVSLQLRL
ncbi:hypothetical protein XELAEV_18003774mg [Xenopus laevis]|nr:hypothetical protein XELAEV_18003774mg [Xenopus laevis]